MTKTSKKTAVFTTFIYILCNFSLIYHYLHLTFSDKYGILLPKRKRMVVEVLLRDLLKKGSLFLFLKIQKERRYTV